MPAARHAARLQQHDARRVVLVVEVSDARVLRLRQRTREHAPASVGQTVEERHIERREARDTARCLVVGQETHRDPRNGHGRLDGHGDHLVQLAVDRHDRRRVALACRAADQIEKREGRFATQWAAAVGRQFSVAIGEQHNVGGDAVAVILQRRCNRGVVVRGDGKLTLGIAARVRANHRADDGITRKLHG